MAYVLAVVEMILAFLLMVIVLLLALPIRVRGSFRVTSDEILESVLDEGAGVEIRRAGTDGCPASDEAREVAYVDVAYGVSATLLGGLFTFDVGHDTGARIRALWWSPGVLARKREARTPKPADSDAPTESGTRAAEKPKAAGRKKRRAAKGRKISLEQVRKYLAPGVRSKTGAALRALSKSLHAKGVLDVELGFPDPGLTGIAFAAWTAVGGPNWAKVRFRPHFESERVDVSGQGGISFVPGRIVWIAASFMLSREIRPLWMKRRRVKEAVGLRPNEARSAG